MTISPTPSAQSTPTSGYISNGKLVDAVQSILEKDGTLSTVRAQLRANVLKTLSSYNESSTITKNVVAEYVDKNGQLSLDVVRDLLIALNLKETLFVYEAEIGIKNFETKREVLGKHLNVHVDSLNASRPLLADMITKLKRPSSFNPLSIATADLDVPSSPVVGNSLAAVSPANRSASPVLGATSIFNSMSQSPLNSSHSHNSSNIIEPVNAAGGVSMSDSPSNRRYSTVLAPIVSPSSSAAAAAESPDASNTISFRQLDMIDNSNHNSPSHNSTTSSKSTSPSSPSSSTASLSPNPSTQSPYKQMSKPSSPSPTKSLSSNKSSPMGSESGGRGLPPLSRGFKISKLEPLVNPNIGSSSSSSNSLLSINHKLSLSPSSPEASSVVSSPESVISSSSSQKQHEYSIASPSPPSSPLASAKRVLSPVESIVTALTYAATSPDKPLRGVQADVSVDASPHSPVHRVNDEASVDSSMQSIHSDVSFAVHESLSNSDVSHTKSDSSSSSSSNGSSYATIGATANDAVTNADNTIDGMQRVTAVGDSTSGKASGKVVRVRALHQDTASTGGTTQVQKRSTGSVTRSSKGWDNDTVDGDGEAVTGTGDGDDQFYYSSNSGGVRVGNSPSDAQGDNTYMSSPGSTYSSSYVDDDDDDSYDQRLQANESNSSSAVVSHRDSQKDEPSPRFVPVGGFFLPSNGVTTAATTATASITVGNNDDCHDDSHAEYEDDFEDNSNDNSSGSSSSTDNNSINGNGNGIDTKWGLSRQKSGIMQAAGNTSSSSTGSNDSVIEEDLEDFSISVGESHDDTSDHNNSHSHSNESFDMNDNTNATSFSFNNSSSYGNTMGKSSKARHTDTEGDDDNSVSELSLNSLSQSIGASVDFTVSNNRR